MRAVFKRFFVLTPFGKRKRKGLELVARLKARNGVWFEFDIRPTWDSIIRYHDTDARIVIIRRRGYMIRGHITKVYLGHRPRRSLVFEGDVIRFLRVSPKTRKALRRLCHVQKSFRD